LKIVLRYLREKKAAELEAEINAKNDNGGKTLAQEPMTTKKMLDSAYSADENSGGRPFCRFFENMYLSIFVGCKFEPMRDMH
jgi:hypothetical protein